MFIHDCPDVNTVCSMKGNLLPLLHTVTRQMPCAPSLTNGDIRYVFRAEEELVTPKELLRTLNDKFVLRYADRCAMRL